MSRTYIPLFPFAEYWWLYPLFSAFVVAVLLLDLGLFHRGERVVRVREAALWVAVWVSAALLFNYGLYHYAHWAFAADSRLIAAGIDPVAAAKRVSLEFLAGYLVEESLSVDNIFVFVLIFRYFSIPARLQHRVLFLGILGAIIFRGAFIAVGAALMRYHWVVVLFGALLILTGGKMLFGSDTQVDPANNPILRLLRKAIPVTKEFHGQRFLVRVGGGLAATPLLVVLVAIETTDILFAIDSVPAIFGLTREPLIVFTSNIFAILGLRSMYFMLAGAIDRFWLLRHGVALVLVFVGVKMVGVAQWFGYEIQITTSLVVIVVILALSVGLSLALPHRSAPELPGSQPRLKAKARKKTTLSR